MSIPLLGRCAGIILALLVVVSTAEVNHNSFTTPDQPKSLKVWVFFKDKPVEGLSKTTITARARKRRSSVGYLENSKADIPVSQGYITSIVACGAILRHTFKWDNAASFEVPIDSIPRLDRLPFVDEITLVGNVSPPKDNKPAQLVKKKSDITSKYGILFDKLERLRVPQAHRYLEYIKPDEPPGSGIVMAVFDNGFRLDHRCFTHLNKRKAVISAYDFVDNDDDVSTNDDHGSSVLSIIAAYDPPYYCGAAWGVDLLLAKTESDDYEAHSEEDNWAAAVIWAEEHGVDIISCSLGYRDFDYDDTVIIDRGDGSFDTLTSYAKSDLDGETTIISRAARGAVDRGVIVVNAVGNEQQEWGDTSLSAPADVDGVVAVGALNDKNLITYYSSFGPTSDGRIKPDLVAPGDINVPNFYSTGSSNDYGSTILHGTSLATPFVSGIFALVKQQHPSLSADLLREKVYRYCRFLTRQTSIDNVYGRGIPDAVRSCMQSDDEVVVTAIDTGNLPLVGAAILDGNGNQLTVTDSNGVARLNSALTYEVKLALSLNKKTRIIQIDSTPAFMEIKPCSLLVTVTDEKGTAMSDVALHFKFEDREIVQYTDTQGVTLITSFFPLTIQFYASKPGYYRSDTLSTAFNESLVKKSVSLAPGEAGFIIYPTLVRRSRGQKLLVRFADDASQNRTTDKWMHAAVRSVNGSLIWKKSLLTDGAPVGFNWNCSSPDGRPAVPGIYFFILTYNGKNYRQKFIIAE